MMQDNRMILLAIIVLLSSISVFGAVVSHTADQILVGSFNTGTFNFQNPSGDEIALLDDIPQIYFRDDTANEDDFWIQTENNNFYVLADRDDSGSFEGPNPLQLEADTDTPYAFGNKMLTTNDEGSGNGIDADMIDALHSWDPGDNNDAIIKLGGSVVEVGRYIDFHHDLVTTDDYDVRLHTDGSINGELYINNYKVWHEGNDGIDSGLSTQYLDGFNINNFPSPARIAVSCSNSHCSWTMQTDTGYDPILYLYANKGFVRIYHRASTNALVMQAGGSGGVRLNSGGDSWVSDSDIRLKKNVTKIDRALEKLSLLNGVYFYWKDKNASNEKQVGVIAQDVEKVLPEIVSEAKGYKTVGYSLISPLLIEASKELKVEKDNEIQELKLKIKNMKDKNLDLKSNNILLKEALCEEFPEKAICGGLQ